MMIRTLMATGLLVAGNALAGDRPAHQAWGRVIGPDETPPPVSEQRRHRHAPQPWMHRQDAPRSHSGDHPAYDPGYYQRPPRHPLPWHRSPYRY